VFEFFQFHTLVFVAKIYNCEVERCSSSRSMCYKLVFIFTLVAMISGNNLLFGELINFFYKTYGSGKEGSPKCDVPGFENNKMKLLRHVSFVDCPVMSWICIIFGLLFIVYNVWFVFTSEIFLFTLPISVGA